MQYIVQFPDSLRPRSLNSALKTAAARLSWLAGLGISRSIHPLFTRPVEDLVQERLGLMHARLGRSLPDLTRWFRLDTSDSLTTGALQKLLDTASISPVTSGAKASVALTIEQIRMRPPRSPVGKGTEPRLRGGVSRSGTPGDSGSGLLALSVSDETTPNLSVAQGYLLSAPSGLGFTELPAWPVSEPCRGLKLAVIDEDYLNTHEDIRIVCDSSNESGVAGQNSKIDHGTCTMGLLFARRTGHGIVGLASGASPIFVHPWTAGTTNAPSTEDAISRATGILCAGDVLLIEAQDNYGHPIETSPPVLDAIKIAVAKGIHIVEPAGNILDNLDTATPSLLADDSGAIMVGAGFPAMHDGEINWPRYQDSSNWGDRVDVQAWGKTVTTTFCDRDDFNSDPLWRGTVNGVIDERRCYTNDYSASSSASALVAGVVATASAVARRLLPSVTLSPAQLRKLLVQTGTPQDKSELNHVGPQPDLVRLLNAVRLWAFKTVGITTSSYRHTVQGAITAGLVGSVCPNLNLSQRKVIRLMALGLSDQEIAQISGTASLLANGYVTEFESLFGISNPNRVNPTIRRLFLIMVASYWKLL